MHTHTIDAVVLACWPCEDGLLDALGIDPALMPLADKPMLQRVVERLAELGCRGILVVPGDSVTPYRTLLGDGRRWGCNIEYCVAVAGARPLSVLGRYLPRIGANVLLAPSDTVVLSDPAAESSVLLTLESGVRCWTGWARLTAAQLRRSVIGADSRAALDELMLEQPDVLRQREHHPLASGAAHALLNSLPHLLRRTGGAAGIARQSDAHGIRIGNGAVVDPGAQLIGPLYIGQHARIRAGAVVGPNAVIGDGSIIDHDSSVRASLVAPSTYVGAGLELDGTLVCGGHLANTRLREALDIGERAVLGNVNGDLRRGPGMAQRVLALAIWTLTWPLARMLARMLPRMLPRILPGADLPSPQPRLALPDWRLGRMRPVPVRLVPAHEALYQGARLAWLSHFLHTFHPGLLDVLAGNVGLIGMTPRTPDEVLALPGYWQHLYRKGCIGLLNETLLLGPDGASPTMRHVADALASEAPTARTLVRVLGRYAVLVGRQCLHRASDAPLLVAPKRSA